MYIVISMPKRKSTAVGVSHSIVALLEQVGSRNSGACQQILGVAVTGRKAGVLKGIS